MPTTTEGPPITVQELHPTGARRLVPCPALPNKLVFEQFTATLLDNRKALTVYLDVEVANDEAEVVAVSMTTTGGGKSHARITEWWKHLTVEAYLQAALGFMTFEGDPEGVAHSVLQPHGDWRVRHARITDQELAQVATWVYEAQDLGLGTGPYVAKQAGVSTVNARQLIMQARKAGFLEPSSSPKGGK